MPEPTDDEPAGVSDADKMRALYDYVMFRPDRSEYRIQSSLIAHMILPSADNVASLESCFQSFVAGSIVAAEGPPMFTSEDEDEIVDSIIRSVPSSSSYSSSSSSYCIESGLQFASDLVEMKRRSTGSAQDIPRESVSGKAQPDRATQAKPSTNKISDVLGQKLKDNSSEMHFGLKNSSNSSSSSSSSAKSESQRKATSVHPTQKRNPFTTGKDQYLNEGGHFPTPAANRCHSTILVFMILGLYDSNWYLLLTTAMTTMLLQRSLSEFLEEGNLARHRLLDRYKLGLMLTRNCHNLTRTFTPGGRREVNPASARAGTPG
jgi:hypothetical protein